MHDNKSPNWRDHLTVHPAAELFPLLSEIDPAALKELAEDIRQHGQREPASYIKDSGGNRVLLDGRNRLDAMEMLGRKIDINNSRMFEQLSGGIDAQAFIISKNIHRRHLSAEDKRDLIGKLLRANPEKSNRTISKLAKVDDKTVAAVRKEKAATAEIPQLKKTVGADGRARKQPTRLKHTDPNCPDCGGNGYFMGGDSGRCHCHGSRPRTSTLPDCSQSGVSQVSTAPEKLTSGLPTGSDSPKTPIEQAGIAKPQTQPNPIIAAWQASTLVHREEFIEDLGDFITDWHATVSARKKDAPLKYRIWNSCSAIEMGIDGEDDDGFGFTQYESLADKLSELEQTLAEDEEEDADGADSDDGLTIPDYLKRGAP